MDFKLVLSVLPVNKTLAERNHSWKKHRNPGPERRAEQGATPKGKMNPFPGGLGCQDGAGHAAADISIDKNGHG
jgi:hypothetical protein